MRDHGRVIRFLRTTYDDVRWDVRVPIVCPFVWELWWERMSVFRLSIWLTRFFKGPLNEGPWESHTVL